MADALAAHAAKRDSLVEALRQARGIEAGPVALAKETSNLFRDRAAGTRQRLDVRGFNQVLKIADGAVEAEGMVPYEDLTRECLAHGVMPAVVPQDRKSTRLNSSHSQISYAVFCLKKKNAIRFVSA